MTTIYDLLTEMQSFVTVDDETLEKAKNSNINTENSWELEAHLYDWQNMQYEDCPELFVQRLKSLLNR